jgi:hypothetical protein
MLGGMLKRKAEMEPEASQARAEATQHGLHTRAAVALSLTLS